MNMDETPARRKKPTAIDWRAIEQRMHAAHAAIEHRWTPSPEETKRILQERAQILAREPERTEGADAHIEVMEFLLAYERYAVESRYVREIYPLETLTPLPCTPSFVLGIVNVRGEILSVIDLKKFFDLPEKGLTDLNKIVVLESCDMLFGILADSITGVHGVPIIHLLPSLPTLTGIREKYLKGVTPERLAILDAAKLLTDENIIVREQVSG
jgi:purine-binding chemotaxis protein CheW